MNTLKFLIFYIALIVPSFALIVGFFVHKAVAWHFYAVTLETYAGVEATWARGGYEDWRERNQHTVTLAINNLSRDVATGNAASRVMLRWLCKAARKFGFSTHPLGERMD